MSILRFGSENDHQKQCQTVNEKSELECAEVKAQQSKICVGVDQPNQGTQKISEVKHLSCGLYLK